MNLNSYSYFCASLSREKSERGGRTICYTKGGAILMIFGPVRGRNLGRQRGWHRS